MNISAIRSHVDSIEDDKALYEESNFDKRSEVVDFIDFHVIGEMEGLMQNSLYTDELLLLKDRAEKIKAELEEIDANLFQKLRTNVRLGEYTSETFKGLVNEYVDFDLGDTQHQQEVGYDNLDLFINGLISTQSIPEQTTELHPEMVYYQKTPARVIFEMADQVEFTEDDVFFDLGSGLGQVAILVRLLTGVTVKGIEFEPAFCNYASKCAAELNLHNIGFINADARKADYSLGTIFFMFTPFKGEIMQEVLAALRIESFKRKIKIITYGPCTAEVVLHNWLHPVSTEAENMYKLTVFTSC